MQRSRTIDLVAWALAVVLAICTGWLQVTFRDLHLALLAAMAFGLTVALIQPRHSWRWGLIIGLAPAIAEFYRLYRGEPVQRGHIEVAFGALLPAFVGALGGTGFRVMAKNVFEKAPEQDKEHAESANRS